ncbi:MAG: tRNA (adenosine(37)-N6)-threonylcarbamoyltransferase complex ATPase subunit type 1 TsaE [Clostridiales bacterium]|nr:tRNA (adenosine(37)-N6)-threonylcarbamoyltransferase complex ATPase subunit type 1 TsaE [Clostridiales bacterium]
MHRYQTHSSDDTAALGRALGALLLPGDAVLIRGELGAGKSVLARGVAAGLGVSGAMPSPTFTLMRPYAGRVPVYHFDLYRLSGPDEFYGAGLSDFIGGDGVALVEWPDVAELQPPARVEVSIAAGGGDDDRALALCCMGLDAARADAIAGALSRWEARP